MPSLGASQCNLWKSPTSRNFQAASRGLRGQSPPRTPSPLHLGQRRRPPALLVPPLGGPEGGKEPQGTVGFLITLQRSLASCPLPVPAATPTFSCGNSHCLIEFCPHRGCEPRCFCAVSSPTLTCPAEALAQPACRRGRSARACVRLPDAPVCSVAFRSWPSFSELQFPRARQGTVKHCVSTWRGHGAHCSVRF